METKQIDIKTTSSEQLGLMLGEIAMGMNQQYQNYQAISNELRSRMPQATMTQPTQEKTDGNDDGA